MTAADDPIIAAHTRKVANGDELVAGCRCGCFYCLRIFSPREIVGWIDDKSGRTASCPYCLVDSVIGDCSGYPITPDFLAAMQEHWFRIR